MRGTNGVPLLERGLGMTVSNLIVTDNKAFLQLNLIPSIRTLIMKEDIFNNLYKRKKYLKQLHLVINISCLMDSERVPFPLVVILTEKILLIFQLEDKHSSVLGMKTYPLLQSGINEYLVRLKVILIFYRHNSAK